MQRLILIACTALGLVALWPSEQLAHAQPVTIGWRPPVGCTTDQVIKWNGTTWVCGAGGNVYTAGDGLTLTALDFDLTYTSDFTITADQLDLSTAVTAPGTLSVASTLTVNNNATVQRDDGGSHANRPILAVTNSASTGSFGHRAELQFNAYDAGNVSRSTSLLAEGSAFTITTPNSGLTTITNGLTVGGAATVNGSTQLGNLYTADFVGINTAPDANHQLTFSGNLGNKIALYPVSGTTALGFGVQNNQLQYYVGDTGHWHSFGYGDSDAFTESQRFDADGQVWLGDTANSAVSNNLDVVTIGNTGTALTTSELKLLKISAPDAVYDLASNRALYGAYADVGAPTVAGCGAPCTAQGGNMSNVAVFGYAHDGDFNYAFYGREGTIYSGDNIQIGGSVGGGITQYTADTGNEYLSVSSMATGVTGDYTAITAGSISSLDATATARANTSLLASAIATRSAGANSVTNYAIRATASGGQNNYAIAIVDGTIIDTNSSVTITDSVVITSTLDVQDTISDSNSALYLDDDLVLGNNAASAISFSNGPSGINTYAGTHLEWTEEFLASTFTGGNEGPFQNSGLNTAQTAAAGRPGTVSHTTSTSASQVSGMRTQGTLDLDDGAWVVSMAGMITTLSTSSEEFRVNLGFTQSYNVASQPNGCWLTYDRGNSTTSGVNSTNANKWELCTATSSVRSCVILDGTSQNGSGGAGSITTVNSPVTAGSWFRATVSGATGSCSATIDGSLRATITTNVPTSATLMAGWSIAKTVGTTERLLDIDQGQLSVDLASARSP